MDPVQPVSRPLLRPCRGLGAQGVHWTTAEVDVAAKAVRYYDSLGVRDAPVHDPCSVPTGPRRGAPALAKSDVPLIAVRV
jgi:hypothetical protein